MSEQLLPKSLTALLGFMLLLVAGCRDEIEIAVNTGDPVPLATQAGAPLFEGMGDFSLPITTTDPHVQRYFDQGMVLAFAFNHAESIRSFKAAQTLDPDCSMCFWGEALATGPNINVTSKGKVIMSPADASPHLTPSAKRWPWQKTRLPKSKPLSLPFLVVTMVMPLPTEHPSTKLGLTQWLLSSTNIPRI